MEENKITIKKYYSNVYFKLAYILWILGYKNIGIYGINNSINSSAYQANYKGNTNRKQVKSQVSIF